jgi:hypothetical protein
MSPNKSPNSWVWNFRPALDSSAIKSLQKALPGYQAVAIQVSFLAAIC